MANKSDKVKADKAKKKYSQVNKKKRLLTVECRNVIGGKAGRGKVFGQFGSEEQHNEIFVTA